MFAKPATRLLVRSAWRRSWRGLVGLAVLIGFGGGFVLATVAGARRTDSSFRRFLDAARTPNLLVETDDPLALERAIALPGVEWAGLSALLLVGIDGSGFQTGEDIVGSTIIDERGGPRREVVTDGREYDPNDLSQIMVNEHLADALRNSLHVGPGATVVLNSFSFEQLELLAAGEDPGPPAGPARDVEIAGVVRDPEDLADTPEARIVVTPAFANEHLGSVASDVQVVVRADPHLLQSVESALATALPDAEVSRTDELEERIQPAIGVLSAALSIVAVVAALAVALIVAQASIRVAARVAADNAVSRALGASRHDLFTSGMVAMAPAVVGGAVLALVLAMLSSPLFPTGLARRAEPAPGVRLDVPVLLVGSVGLAIVGAVAAIAAVVVRARVVSARPFRARRGGRVMSWLPAPAGQVGVLMAFARPAGTRSLAGRQAFTATVVGVAGVVTAITVDATLSRIVDTPSRFGATFDGVIETETDDDVERLNSVLATEPGIGDYGQELVAEGLVAVGPDRDNTATVDPTAMHLERGSIEPLAVTGHNPRSAEEIALGRSIADALGADIGDTIELRGTDEDVPTSSSLRVVGLIVAPGDDDVDTGVFVTEEALRHLAVDVTTETTIVAFAADVDVDAVRARLARAGFPILRPPTPSSVANLDHIGGYPALLAGFLIALGGGGLLHTLLSTARSRHRDHAVLRAIGFERSQTRSSVRAHAMTVVLAGLAVGLPLGIVVASSTTTMITERIGVPDGMSIPVGSLVLVAPAALVAAAATAVWPGLVAVRGEIGQVLRAE